MPISDVQSGCVRSRYARARLRGRSDAVKAVRIVQRDASNKQGVVSVPTPLERSYRSTVGDTSWFVRDRFGIFVHWGLYSLAARHEWVQHVEQIPEDVYAVRYAPRFDPDLFDPAAWARAIADAGARYAVVTAKHHEGFCLWDSQFTDYTAPRTPAGRDLLRPALSALRDQGLRTGIYYSLIDWHHPHYHADPHLGPYRNAGAEALSAINRHRDMSRYARYMQSQLGELLGGGYGPIDIVWFDFSYPNDAGTGKGRDHWQSRELLQRVRSLMPRAIVNDRLDLVDDLAGWDFRTSERAQPRRPMSAGGQPAAWEACHPLGFSWGYYRDEPDWKTPEQCVGLLIDSVSKGGNLLLNIAPTGRGDLDDRTLGHLSAIGRWMRKHGRSIYSCGVAPIDITCPPDCRLTYNPATRRLYLHVPVWPETGEVVVGGLPLHAIGYAQLLNDASEIALTDRPSDAGWAVTVKLPRTRPDVLVPVVELFIDD
jgi:alpha-L-fucosidase